MKNTKIAAVKFVQSLVFLPFLSGMVPVGMAVNENTPFLPTVAFVSNQAEDEAQVALRNQEKLLDEQGAKIDAYFEKRNAPLKGFGRKMAEEAMKNGIDYRLVAGIATIESQAGKDACDRFPENKYGWGSCKIGIGGTDERAIELISLHLGGNHENTDHYYKDKSVDKILDTYNPPSIRPDYKKLVKGVMLKISSEPIVS
jgi:hypothetical protein